MYHSSEYAKLTDEQWEEMKEELIAEYNKIADETGEIKVL
jgi:post-segregation antitoxin (ccd killing protein)